MHTLAPAAENWPAAQFPHAEDEGCPVDAAYVPAAQLTHADAPVPGWYRPDAQSVHAVKPADDNWPATQLKHDDTPALG